VLREAPRTSEYITSASKGPLTSGRQTSHGQVGLGLLVAGLFAGTAAGLALQSRRELDSSRRRPLPRLLDATEASARDFRRASSVLSAAVLFDSGMEHYRGYFFNPAMYMPLAVSSLTLGAALTGSRPAARSFRNVSFALAALAGVAGTGFHIYNVAFRRGGITWQNLFYAAPLGAPAALALAGIYGFLSEGLGSARRGFGRVFGIPAARLLAGFTSLALFGTTAEAGLFHFRGAYHDPFMYVPVSIPPLAAAFLARAALRPSRGAIALAQLGLRLVTLVGVAGAGFHAYGVHRNMGGWRNWKQNTLAGPPLPAPPSFTGVALAGLGALRLLKVRHA
jgi:hypothetical protein